MKDYRFRLAAVLRVRRVQEELARAEVVRARGQLRAAETSRIRSQERYDATAVSSTAAVSTAAFRNVRAQRQLAAERLSRAQRAVSDASEELETTRTSWHQRAVRVSALERLDDRQRAEHTLQTRQAEDAQATESFQSLPAPAESRRQRFAPATGPSSARGGP